MAGVTFYFMDTLPDCQFWREISSPMPTTDATRDFVDHRMLARLARLTLRPRGLVEGSFTGLHKSPHRGSSVEFAEYRKYVKGDDIRHIDWRVYARSDRFYLKEFEADTHLRCYLVIDCSGSIAFGSKLDQARRLAAAIAYLAVQQGDHVGLLCFNQRVVEDIPPRGKPSHLRSLFDTLGAVEPEGETNIVEVLHDLAERIRKRALVIVISDFFTEVEPLLSCFQHLRHRKHDLAAFHLMDEAELDFRFDRPIRFVDLEGRAALTTEPVRVREQYLAALEGYREELREGCGRFDVDYQFVSTGTSCEAALSTFLLGRAGR